MKIFGVFKNFLFGLPIGVTFFDVVGYIARVDGVSMQPALNPEDSGTDYVFLSRWSIRSYEVERGDIVSLISPKDPQQTIIKRIVGLQGDIILTLGYKNDVVKIPEGHCWVEGDHTGHTLDSNSFGPVSLGLITAKASFIIWPPSRWQVIKTHLPQHRRPLNQKRIKLYDESGDVDNDGNTELIIGNDIGEVVVYKGSSVYQSITGLGLVACVVVGDILNISKNCLVIISADGWCFIYSSYNDHSQESESNTDTSEAQSAQNLENVQTSCPIGNPLKCVHVQRIPANTKVGLLADVDGDGSNELVLGLTDRVVRSYRWFNNPDIITQAHSFLTESSHVDSTGKGKLVGLNKWECANQIGSVSLHHGSDGYPALLVAQPGGTFMRIRCQSDDERPSAEQSENNSARSDCLAASGVDYQFLGLSRMRNPNISTEIVGDLKSNSSTECTNFCSAESSIEKSSEKSSSNCDTVSETASEIGRSLAKISGSPYAIATLDGTIMLVQNEIILWAMQVDHQIFALTKMDVNGDGLDEIIACSWDGHTYILDQNKNSVRLLLDEPVQAFTAGMYTTSPGIEPAQPCFVYVTFTNKVYLCYNDDLKNMVAKAFSPDFSLLKGPLANHLRKNVSLDKLDRQTKKELVEYLLYSVKDEES